MQSKIGFGFLRLPKAGDSYDWDGINAMVDRFLELGGRYFDTCYTYLDGNSERGIRDCLVKRHPRDVFQLADKLPGYLCRTYDDCQKYFDEELERCGVEWFDVYMLHWLNGKNYAIAEQLDQFRFLREKKAAGQAKRIGFSYHDSASLLERILSAHPEVDVVQLQINYLDWDSAGIESGRCYEVCKKYGKSVIVMEPIKGGTLAALPDEANRILQEAHPDWSPADWALRFVQSMPLVEVCLSGMNAMPQIEDNMRPFAHLEEQELHCLQEITKIIERQVKVACTGCRYCVSHCPKKIPIPDIFRMFNEIYRNPDEDWKIKPSYHQLTQTQGKASECIVCRSCEKHCPQHISIPDLIAQAALVLE